MGTISRLQARDSEGRTAPGHMPRPGRIAVHIDAVHDAVHVRIAGARMPARIYLYVDGDLADSWVDVEAFYELEAARLAPGPHAITARAVDTLGRWGGASTVIETRST